jgi:hypothetical protein
MIVTVLEQRHGERAAGARQPDRRTLAAVATLWLFLLLTGWEWLWGSARLDTAKLERPGTALLDRVSALFFVLGSVQVTNLLLLVALALLYRSGQHRAALLGWSLHVAVTGYARTPRAVVDR